MTACFAALVCLKGFYQLGASRLDVIEIGAHIAIHGFNAPSNGFQVIQRKTDQLSKHRLIPAFQFCPEIRLAELVSDEIIYELRVLLFLRVINLGKRGAVSAPILCHAKQGVPERIVKIGLLVLYRMTEFMAKEVRPPRIGISIDNDRIRIGRIYESFKREGFSSSSCHEGNSLTEHFEEFRRK